MMIRTSQKEKKEYASSELKEYTHTKEHAHARNERRTNYKRYRKISQTRTRERDQHVQPRFFVNKHPVDAIHERFGFHVVKEPRDAAFVARVGVTLDVTILSLR